MTVRNAELLLNAMLRDGRICHLCGGGPRKHDPFEPDHQAPQKHRPDLIEAAQNVKVAHRSCNRSKGAQTA